MKISRYFSLGKQKHRQQAAPSRVSGNGVADAGHDCPGRRGELHW